MRVIAGVHRGRRLVGPKGQALRPTSDRVKEALFDILATHIVGSRVLDLYAGTGALGIEALSRGAVHVTFVEQDPRTVRLLQANLARCGPTPSAASTIMTGRVETFLRRPPLWRGPYDIVLADPPYAWTMALIDALAMAPVGVFAEQAILAIEHAAKTELPSTIGSHGLRRRYLYGDTALSLFHRPEERPAAS